MTSDVFKSGYYTYRTYDSVHYFDVQETFIKVFETDSNKAYDCPIFIQKGQDLETIFLKNKIVHPYDLNIYIIEDINYAVDDKCENLVGRCKCVNINQGICYFNLCTTDHKISVDFEISHDKIEDTYKVPHTDLTVVFSRVLKDNNNVWFFFKEEWYSRYKS